MFPTIRNALDHAKLNRLTMDNPDANNFVREVDRIFLVEKSRAIFFKGEQDYYYKYVIEAHPLYGPPRKLGPRLCRVVERGLGYQTSAQDLPGVQKIKSKDFVNGIPGLIGPLEFVKGDNLNYGLIGEDPEYVLDLFMQLEEDTISQLSQRRILHGDIKPGNIVFTQGKKPRLKLIDWSLARDFDVDRIEFSRRAWGTQGFIHSDRERAVDLYGLGNTLAYVLDPLVTFPAYPNNVEVRLSVLCLQTLLEEKVGSKLADYYGKLVNSPREYNMETGIGINELPASEDDGLTWMASPGDQSVNSLNFQL
jgi:serine/threonine protein kinase